VRIDQRGRIVLPVGLRERLGIEIGDFVMLSVEDNKITAIPSMQEGRLISRNVFEI
jgi:AbrB family looped-hinge helix DNA binding protein